MTIDYPSLNSLDEGGMGASSPMPPKGNDGHGPPVCEACEQPLIQQHYGVGYYWLCDTVGCRLVRQPQGLVLKAPEDMAHVPWHLRYRPTYEQHKAEVRENYQVLRRLGVSPDDATRMKSNKQTQTYLDQHLGQGDECHRNETS